MSKSPSALTSWARVIADALTVSGVDPHPLFLEAGLDIQALDDPNARYPVERTTRLWRLAVAATGDPCFGLVVARCVKPTTFHALNFSVLSSETLRDALARIARYSRVVADVNMTRFRLIGDRYRFSITPVADTERASHESIDAMMATIVGTCRRLVGDGFTTLGIELERPAPPDPTPLLRFFRAPITFSASENAFELDRPTAEQPLATANAELAHANDRVLDAHLARLDSYCVSERVRQALRERLPSGEPAQEQVARVVGMSVRNLQRRLEAEGTTFRGILDETRRELAMSYVADRAAPVREIAGRVGFADLSSFSRAFRRWTGRSPRDYRRTAIVAPRHVD